MKNYKSGITYESCKNYLSVYVDGEFYCNCDHGELPEIKKEIENEKKRKVLLQK